MTWFAIHTVYDIVLPYGMHLIIQKGLIMYYNRNIFSYKGVINRLHFTIYNICYNAFAYLIGIVLNNYLSRVTSLFLYFLLFAIFILAAFNIKKLTLDILAVAKNIGIKEKHALDIALDICKLTTILRKSDREF